MPQCCWSRFKNGYETAVLFFPLVIWVVFISFNVSAGDYGAFAKVPGKDMTAGGWSINWNRSSEDIAKRDALKSCGSSKCKVFATFGQRQCFAVAQGDRGTAWATRPNPAPARAAALSACAKYGNCRIFSNPCSGRTRTLSSPEDVGFAQEMLNLLGYNAGSVDGVMGSGTRRALLAFQHANDIRADGVLTTLENQNLASLAREKWKQNSSISSRNRPASRKVTEVSSSGGGAVVICYEAPSCDQCNYHWTIALGRNLRQANSNLSNILPDPQCRKVECEGGWYAVAHGDNAMGFTCGHNNRKAAVLRAKEECRQEGGGSCDSCVSGRTMPKSETVERGTGMVWMGNKYTYRNCKY
jgi:peptidoglycan hydrolase-like protein with peptidoglycan-binding domain